MFVSYKHDIDRYSLYVTLKTDDDDDDDAVGLTIWFRFNIMDNLMSMMEKYTYNLEECIEERTQQLVEENRIINHQMHLT